MIRATHTIHTLKAVNEDTAYWVECGYVRIVNGRGVMRLECLPYPVEIFTGDIFLCTKGKKQQPPESERREDGTVFWKPYDPVKSA